MAKRPLCVLLLVGLSLANTQVEAQSSPCGGTTREYVYLGSRLLAIVGSGDTGTLGFTTAAVSVNEAATAILTVQLVTASGQPLACAVTVNYATVDGTALRDVDYVGAEGTLTIPAGSMAAPIAITTLPDELFEGDETFTVVLSGATGAAISTGLATVTIIDDDGAPTLSVGDVVVMEGDENPPQLASFQVQLSKPIALPVSTAYSTADGTATAGGPLADYVPTAGSLTFTPGAGTQWAANTARAADLCAPLQLVSRPGTRLRSGDHQVLRRIRPVGHGHHDHLDDFHKFRPDAV